MLKRILSVVALCASVSPAFASPHSLLRQNSLTRAVEASGVTVLTSHPECEDSYGFYKPASKLMVICVSNHYEHGKMDYAELGDTLRHESIHVAQVCNGNGKPVPILSWNQIAKYSNNRILSIVQRYKPSHQHIEYEAFTSAAIMTNTQVAKVVRDFCF